MAQLPFLVVHGAVLWKMLVPALSIATLAGIRAIRGRKARRRARVAGDERVRTITSLVAGAVCLRGTLRGGSISTVTKAHVTHDLVEGSPWLDHDDGTRVVLPKAMTVIAPAHAASTIVGVPRATPAALRREVTGVGWTLGTVTDGDVVVVAGMAALTTAAEAGYRDDATTWALTAATGDVLAIAAAHPTARAVPYHPAAVASGFVAFALVWLGALYGLGSAAARIADTRPERTTATSIPPFGAVSIASAMPGSRHDALAALASDFSDRRFVHRGSMLPLEDELDTLLDECLTASRQFDHVRLDAAVESARACGDRDMEAVIQVFRGDYAAALALAPPRAIVREYAAIGAGDWNAAATAADAIAIEHADRPKATNRDRCIAALFHAYAGDPAPLARTTAELHGPTEPAACRFATAIMQPPDRELAALQSFIADENARDMVDRDFYLVSMARQLLSLLGAPGVPVDNDVVFFLEADSWLAAAGPPSDVPSVREARAATAVVRGDFAAAHAELGTLGADRDVSDTATVIVALHEGTEPAVRYIHPAFTEVLALRSGQPALRDALHGVYPAGCGTELGAGVASALAGDGGPLATVFSECSVYYIYMPSLLYGILPRVHEHRAELADALRVYRDSITTFSFSNVPFRLVTQLADYRDISHLAGDDDEAARMQSTISRHAHALADPRRIVAFEVVDH